MDDLNHLKRGGRVSAVSAALGTVLNIKPVLHVDDEGHLIFMEKVRGRRQSIKRLAEMMEKTGIDLKDQVIFISHGDCMDDVNYLISLIQDKVKEIHVSYVGPVIGAHSGPGTLALFFLGTQR